MQTRSQKTNYPKQNKRVKWAAWGQRLGKPTAAPAGPPDVSWSWVVYCTGARNGNDGTSAALED